MSELLFTLIRISILLFRFPSSVLKRETGRVLMCTNTIDIALSRFHHQDEDKEDRKQRTEDGTMGTLDQ